MNIVFAASEAAPYMKTGGLGDVAQALPLALSKYSGSRVLLFIPFYGSIKRDPAFKTELVSEFELKLGWRGQYAGLHRLVSRRRKLEVYFIDNELYFCRDRAYGYSDDGERFAFFSKAILQSLVILGEKPDIIHCNDWQTALIPTFLHAFYHDKLGTAKTVFTIHNIEYQGWVHPYFLGDVLGLPVSYDSTFKFGDQHNFMKSAILKCDALTTVSRTYAKEICYPYYAHGLHDIINDHAFKLTGIVNGIDTDVNDPATDPNVFHPYDVSNVFEEKPKNKADLQKELGLPIRPDVPLIGIVSRLVEHKGMSILCESLEKIASMDVQFAVLGTGDSEYESWLKSEAERHPDRFSVNIRFGKHLASRIYAGADIYIMPSKSEPCGLSQLLAMHYGTVPVVHETGGLKDTVAPFFPDTGEGTGFVFRGFTGPDMMDSLRSAVDLYNGDRDSWNKLVMNCMTKDVSWKLPAGEYMELYRRITNKK